VAVEVSSEIVIERPRAEVAAFAANPDNATAWYAAIENVKWRTPRPLAVGSRICFVARFLGKQIDYVYEVVELEPGERFVMQTDEGPFPMETTYAWEDEAGGGTRMVLRNRGNPHGVSRLAQLFLVKRAMRRANTKDLRRLKDVLESRR
jgi:uncharacterized membrane protein